MAKRKLRLQKYSKEEREFSRRRKERGERKGEKERKKERTMKVRKKIHIVFLSDVLYSEN